MSAKTASTATARKPSLPEFSERRRYVLSRLKELGLPRRELLRSEAKRLPYLLHRDELVGGVISGRCDRGHIMIVATDRRVIVLDCKPMFDNTEDISYFVVAGVSVSCAGFICTVTLHTRLGDFSVRTSNQKLARHFKHYIDARCIENQRQVNPSGNGGML